MPNLLFGEACTKGTCKIQISAQARKIIAHCLGADITTEKLGALNGHDSAG